MRFTEYDSAASTCPELPDAKKPRSINMSDQRSERQDLITHEHRKYAE